MFEKLFCVFCLSLMMLLSVYPVDSAPVNVGAGKPVRANFTCSGEIYYNQRDIYRDITPYPVHICANETTHPPSAMLDGNVNTHWQTASLPKLEELGYGRNNPDAKIEIDLLQVIAFLVRRRGVKSTQTSFTDLCMSTKRQLRKNCGGSA